MYKFEVILTVHRRYYVEIKFQLDATDYIYCRFYCMLNMFRAILCPSLGAREYYTDGRCLPKTLIHSPHDTRRTLQQHIQRSTLNAKNANSA